MKKNAGFTLIEVMITITILATLTMLTAQAINQAIRAKVKLQDQIDDVSRMRDAMRLIERDINLAFHYRDLEKEMEQILKKKNNPNQQQQQIPGFPQTPPVNQAPEEVKRMDPATNFIGSGEAIDFVTSNNAQTVRDAKQADFVEVGYTLKDCKNLREGKGSSKCLWRRSTPFVDLDVTKGGDELVLLENVSEFKLRYMGKGKQDWVSDWRSDEQGDGVTKGKFPQAVEISLTVEKKTKGKSKKYSMQVISPIHFPNNSEETANANAQGNQNSWPPNQQQNPASTQ